MTTVGQDTSAELQITELEKQWNAAIQRQDLAAMDRFLADSYFLAIAVHGSPLQIFPRASWLETLKVYKAESLTFDDIRVHCYGDTAVVLLLYTQKATVRGQDRSGQFVLTDIWVKQNEQWRIAERHSSRPEAQAASRPFEQAR